MSLHMVFSAQGLTACQRVLQAHDHVVLIGDGVYGASALGGCSFSVIEEDLLIRGLAPNLVGHVIDYAQLVSLCAEHSPCVSWKD